MVEFIIDCQDSESGGFRPVQGHDPHILNTLSAVQVGKCSDKYILNMDSHQVAAMYNCLDRIDRDGVVR